MAHLSHETVEKFTSDFKIVADYFVQQASTNEYIPSTQGITHVRETLDLLGVMGGDERFITAYNENNSIQKEGGNTMSSIALDNMINKAVANEKREIAISLNSKGLSIEDIADSINCKVDVVKKWLGSSVL